MRRRTREGAASSRSSYVCWFAFARRLSFVLRLRRLSRPGPPGSVSVSAPPETVSCPMAPCSKSLVSVVDLLSAADHGARSDPADSEGRRVAPLVYLGGFGDAPARVERPDP